MVGFLHLKGRQVDATFDFSFLSGNPVFEQFNPVVEGVCLVQEVVKRFKVDVYKLTIEMVFATANLKHFLDALNFTLVELARHSPSNFFQLGQNQVNFFVSGLNKLKFF